VLQWRKRSHNCEGDDRSTCRCTPAVFFCENSSFGDPRERDPKRVLDDLLDGMVTAEDARRDYGVVVDKHGRIDLTETNRVRALSPLK